MDATSAAPAPLLQGLWKYVRAGQEEILLSPYLPASCALLMHVLLCAPFLALDSLGSVCPRVRSWRIAAGSEPPPTPRQWLDCFCRILFRYVTVVLPASALFQRLRSPRLPELAPSCWQLFVEVLACVLLFDAFFFLWHYCIHRIPWLYRSIHEAHHRHRNPFALAAQDASSAELLSLLLLSLSCAWLLGCHPLSEVIFHLLNSWLAVEDHCGYNLPWASHRLFPFLGGAPTTKPIIKSNALTTLPTSLIGIISLARTVHLRWIPEKAGNVPRSEGRDSLFLDTMKCNF